MSNWEEEESSWIPLDLVLFSIFISDLKMKLIAHLANLIPNWVEL